MELELVTSRRRPARRSASLKVMARCGAQAARSRPRNSERWIPYFGCNCAGKRAGRFGAFQYADWREAPAP